MVRPQLWPALLACGVLLATWTTQAAGDPAANPPEAPATNADDPQTTEAKSIFATQCGWCHGDYGKTAGKGPQLAGTQMTEHQVEQRIRNGKPGYMPSFRKSLSDDQIALMARYIKSLAPN